MSVIKMDGEKLLQHYKEKAPRELIELYEGVADKFYDIGDIKRDPVNTMYSPEFIGLTTDLIMEAATGQIDNVDYNSLNESVIFEGYDDIHSTESVSLADSHKRNIRQLLENSATEVRTIANQWNLNQLTPFDAFLPFTIVRSYEQLVGKDLIPTQTPPKDFIRIKQEYKYIVTKDNKRYLRPDVYNDAATAKLILDSAKGARVTQAWFPEGTEVDEGEADYTYGDKFYKVPDRLTLNNFDLLEACGGNREIGDDLDINISVNAVRAVVENAVGETQVVEMSGFHAYPDVTSISPQRSVSFAVRIPVKNAEGEIESFVEDKVYGEFNAYTKSFNLVSAFGYVKQVQFDGNMSNKNNLEYISFTNEFSLEEHPIPEGYTVNVPITKEDMDLFNRTASIDIVAVAANETTELFTQLEDGYIINKINEDRAQWVGKGEGEHPFQHMHGPIVFEKHVSIARDSTRFLKINAQIQDNVQFAISSLINDIRDTLRSEPFRLVAFAHPNVCTLFTGADNTDWKVTPGSSVVGDGIRNDYRMGIHTCQGDSFRICSSIKFNKKDGVRFLIYPVNEQNFLTWKHFKFSMWFSRDYRNPQMQLVPNFKGYSRFYTHSYIPLQASLFIDDWE